MDVPTEGLAPVIVDHVVEALRKIATSGTGLLLIEQNMTVATEVSDCILVMMNGAIALETNAKTLLSGQALQNGHLGVSAWG
ncbi:hypothetical protein ACN2XU_19675 [Primorskyibacter sp. 2E107]|uniref:hypothetical protein n=1 Tax=Primorskyibacter sp. 2E107 TaxID=3403458 RepID=UPI003AF7979B